MQTKMKTYVKNVDIFKNFVDQRANFYFALYVEAVDLLYQAYIYAK